MSGIDESRTFVAVAIAVLTVSDTRTLETDRSGDTPGMPPAEQIAAEVAALLTPPPT